MVTATANARFRAAASARFASRNTTMPPTISGRPAMTLSTGKRRVAGDTRRAHPFDPFRRAMETSALRVQMIAEPVAANATDRTRASPNHTPDSRRSSISPTRIIASATSCRGDPWPAAAPSLPSFPRAQQKTYTATPKPPAKERTTNANRTRMASTPSCSASPPATPASTRSPVLRTGRYPSAVAMRRRSRADRWISLSLFISAGPRGRLSIAPATPNALTGQGDVPPGDSRMRPHTQLRDFSGTFPMFGGLSRTHDRSVNDAPTRPPPTHSQPLARTREGRMLGGVAAGLADYVGVDPIVFRAAFVVLTFLGGIGIFLYLLAWLMIPPARSGSRVDERLPARLLGRVRGRPAWVGVVLLAVGGALVARRLGIWHPTVFWGVTLLVAGIVLFREDRPWRDGSRAGVPVWGDGSGLGVPAGEPPTPPATALSPPGRAPRWPFGPRRAAPSPPPRVRREPSALGWLALGTVLLAVGSAAGLSEAEFVHLTLTQFLALGLTVLGVALMVGAWRGRARWLILPGILLIPLVLVTSLIDVPIGGGLGNRYVNPRSIGEIHRSYKLTAGDLVIDLTSLKFGPGEVLISATVAAGRISVLAPDFVSIVARAHAGAGSVSLFGQSDQGIRVDVARTSTAPGSLGNLILDLRTGIGGIVVYRVQNQTPADESGEPSPVPTLEPSAQPSPSNSGGG
jgi:phage shock protein PspC (stress-responsive transcriptional regulator)